MGEIYMKKLFYVLIVSLAIFSLVGCNTTKQSNNNEYVNSNENIDKQESDLLQKDEVKFESKLVTGDYPKVKMIIDYLNNTYSFYESGISLDIVELGYNEYEIRIQYIFNKETTEKQVIKAVLYTIEQIDSEFKSDEFVKYDVRCVYEHNGEITSIIVDNSNSVNTDERTNLTWKKGNDVFDPNDILSSEDSSEPSTVTEQEIPKEQSEVETKIISTTKAEFGEQNYIMVNYIPEDNYVLIKAKGKENLSNEATVKGMYLSISKILKELKDIPDLNIDFNIEYSMIDTSGNLSSMIVIKATYTNATRSNINWDRFLWENMDIIADEWWIHPALQEAWQK